MAHNSNWIKLYRQIFDNDLWQSDEPFDRRSAWIDLILLANHKDGYFINSNGILIKVPRGSHFTSTRVLADRWHWSRGKVDRYLRLLSETGSVTLNVTPSGTLLSLVNYDDYQGGRATDRATNDTTDKATNRATDEPQTEPEQEEYKNDKENKEASSSRSGRDEIIELTEEEVKEWYDKNGGSINLVNDRRQLDVSKGTERSRVQQLRDLLYGITIVPGGGSAAGDSECD